MSSKQYTAKKLCFVTIGATASFDELIKSVLSNPFLEALKTANYTDLLLQHGLEGQKILDEFKKLSSANNETSDIRVNGFAFNKKGLGEEMRAAKGGADSAEGVVISHAGNHCVPIGNANG
jgi:beta-1,4-N-acetylglucosaminyltransferase